MNFHSSLSNRRHTAVCIIIDWESKHFTFKFIVKGYQIYAPLDLRKTLLYTFCQGCVCVCVCEYTYKHSRYMGHVKISCLHLSVSTHIKITVKKVATQQGCLFVVNEKNALSRDLQKKADKWSQRKTYCDIY